MRDLAQSVEVLRFGPFEVDLRSQELRRRGIRIRLRGQSFDVLATLLSRPGEWSPAKSCNGKLWPAESFGDFEHGLNAAVNRLREALSDSADQPRFIETLPRRGYRFVAPVERVGLGSAPTPLAQAESSIQFEEAHSPGAETATSTQSFSIGPVHRAKEGRNERRFVIALASLLLLLCAGAFLFQHLKQKGRSAHSSSMGSPASTPNASDTAKREDPQ